jgi:hypothetical protein
MPTWLLVTLMMLATYRITRLVVKDDFPPVLWVRDRLCGGWRPLTTKEIASLKYTGEQGDARVDVRTDEDGVRCRYIYRAGWVPDWLADLLSCPWCASGWIALILTLAVALTVGVPAPVLVWPAVWAAGSLLAARDWA